MAGDDAGRPAGELINGYTVAQMMSYYLVLTLVDAFTAVAEDDWQIAADIKDGQISQFLLKPIDYLRLSQSLHGRSGRLHDVCNAAGGGVHGISMGLGGGAGQWWRFGVCLTGDISGGITPIFYRLYGGLIGVLGAGCQSNT